MNNNGAGAFKGIEKDVLLNSIRLKDTIKSKLKNRA